MSYSSSMRAYQQCSSAFGWQKVVVLSSKPGKTYEVMLPPWDRVEDEIICECPSYLHRSRCRHQREALVKVCNWCELDSLPQTPEQAAKKICPECGGPTKVVIDGD